MNILVKCTLFVTIDVPDGDMDAIKFQIEENGCPGTGLVGNAIESACRAGFNADTCWACNLNGTNEIVEKEN